MNQDLTPCKKANMYYGEKEMKRLEQFSYHTEARKSTPEKG